MNTDTLNIQHSSDPVIATKDLTKRVSALDNPSGDMLDILTAVNLEIKSAETISIIGASGSGKSTLLGLLAGLDQPSSGTIMLAGNDLGQLDEDGRAALRGAKVGFVFQSFQLLPGLTALENVMLPLELRSDSGAATEAVELLARVGLSERLHHYPQQLSGGEQQRVAIARAFVTRPMILFADEPTGNLDTVTSQYIIDLLFEMNQENNTTLVIVTHDEALAKRCGRCLRLENGILHHA
ncbi:MAG: ABC transporter ATP-binding protein [Gammaproteobacteria bacterium]|nr:ABC transporter ATP-binding protein [Gammaproteobacteria bacterium]